jgi:glutathione S-transferase
MITCYAFRAVPPFAQGLVRDLRVRWALEEVGLPYRTTLVGDGAMARSAYRKIQPFGQIPAIEDGNLVLFESGAIVLHIAERFPGLLPDDAAGRAHATQWMFAALDTIEGRVQQLAPGRLSGQGAPMGSGSPLQVEVEVDRAGLGHTLVELGVKRELVAAAGRSCALSAIRLRDRGASSQRRACT